MKKRMFALLLALMAIFALTACTSKAPEKEEAVGGTPEIEEAVVEETTRVITYLGESYEVPAKVERIVITGSMESMEDALVLAVNPVGAISVGGEFPEMFAPVVGEAQSIGEKTQPDLEAIVKLEPDVILGSSKFPEETMEKLKLIATTFPVSHISTNWGANLELLGELTGKEKEAKEAIEAYNQKIEESKGKLAETVKDKTVVAIRIRQGNLFIYPEAVFFNPVLYTDLGIAVPAPVQLAKAQENISLEQFTELNPDYIFVQFSLDENADNPKALEDLEANPIWSSITAVKEGKVFVNVVDPLAQGGTAWSKAAFLDAVVESLTK